MISKEIEVINKLGLHARAAAKLVNCATAFAANITVHKDQQSADCKSIMAVMMLAAAKGTVLTFELDGRDEQAAWEAIATLIQNRFDEEQ